MIDLRQLLLGKIPRSVKTGLWDSCANPPITMAAAATMNIGQTASQVILMTGSATITSLGNGQPGIMRTLIQATSANSFFTSSAKLIFNGVNAGSSAGSTFLGAAVTFYHAGNGVWYCLGWTVAGAGVTAILAGGTGTTSAVGAYRNLSTDTSIASATTTNMTTAGALATITGTTTITAFTTEAIGVMRDLYFTGTPLLTHNATSLILPGGANIQTVAGDSCRMASLGSGNWRCEWYQQAASQPFRGQRYRVATDLTNATATMSNLTGLSATLTAGRTYTGKLVIFANNSVAAEGLQFDFNGGAATMTSIEFGFATTPPGAGIALGTLTSVALGTAITATTASTGDAIYTIEFTLVCNAGGTLIPRFAEVTHTAGTATAKTGSYMVVKDIP